jgi:hypothetical protein
VLNLDGDAIIDCGFEQCCIFACIVSVCIDALIISIMYICLHHIICVRPEKERVMPEVHTCFRQ